MKTKLTALATTLSIFILMSNTYAYEELGNGGTLNITIPRSQSLRGYALPGIGRNFNSQCLNFIRRDGSYGPWGVEMIRAMREVENYYKKEIFFGDNSTTIMFGQRCKSTEYFRSLSREQQENIWVWLWASIAQAESSCDPKEQAKGIKNTRYGRYNTADGLYQLEYRKETRAANERSQRFCSTDRAVNTQNLQFQFRCGAAIMANTTKKAGGYLKNSSPYWQKLKSNQGQIFNLLEKHPLCK